MGDTDTSWPTWWETDREHAPVLMALRFLRAEHFIRNSVDEGWHIDFEDLWANGPCSGGERCLIGLAWGLYNLGWAADWAKDHPDRLSPLRAGHPSRAAEILGEDYKRTYVTMVQIGFCHRESEVAELVLPSLGGDFWG